MKLNSIALFNDNHSKKATFLKYFSFLDNKKYAHLPEKAKKLYSLFYNRYKLSKINKNKFTDEDGNLFFNYTLESIEEALNCCHETALKYKDMLIKCGLIAQQRLGLNKANRYYLLEPEYEDADLYEEKPVQVNPTKQRKKIKKAKTTPDSHEKATTMPFFMNESGYNLLLAFKNYGFLTSKRQIKQVRNTLSSIAHQMEKDIVKANLLTHEEFFHMFIEYTPAQVATQEAFKQVLFRIKEHLDLGESIVNFGAYLRRATEYGLYDVLVKRINEVRNL
ncbi:replication initiator protein A [Lactobacillus sp. PSON]|uniref:replication initiator protein A n=1 Tax=Lactobacillus sp. PSON TaxID=3455454 RepID=UPI004042310C